MGIDPLVVLVGKGNVKSLGKAVAKVVGSTGLQSLSVVHHALDGVGSFGTVELLFVGLLTPGDRHGQHVLTEVGVDVQHLLGESLGFLGSGVHGVAFLPQKFPVTQERTGGLFPAQHAAPLVVLHGQIPVGLNHLGEMLTEQGFRGGTDAVALFQLLAAAHGNPGALRSEAFHMVLFLLQQAFGNQHGHVDILHAHLLELLVHDVLDILPDGVAIGTVNKHTLDGRVVNQLGFFAHVGKPLGKVYLHVGDLLDLLFFCHFISSSQVFWKFRKDYCSTGLQKLQEVLPEKLQLLRFWKFPAAIAGFLLAKPLSSGRKFGILLREYLKRSCIHEIHPRNL